MPRMSRNEESEEKGEGRGGKRKELLGLMFRKLTIFSLPTTYLPSQCKVPWPGKALKLLWEAGMIGPDSIPQLKRSLFFLFYFHSFSQSPILSLFSIGKNARDNSGKLFQLWSYTN